MAESQTKAVSPTIPIWQCSKIHLSVHPLWKNSS